MKVSVPALAFLVVAGMSPALAAADDPKSVCIFAYEIDHTEAPDDNTLLFYMRDGTVWKTAASDRCTGLRMNGFTYQPSNPATDQICANLQEIRVRDTRQNCALGDITRISPEEAARLLNAPIKREPVTRDRPR